MHYECRYCDGGWRCETVEGDVVCGSCGAEWDDAKVLIKEERQ